MSIAVEGSLGGRVLGADDDDALLHVGIGLPVVVGELGKFLARHAEAVREVEEAGGHDDVPAAVHAARGLDAEIALTAVHAAHRFVEPDVHLLASRHATVVLDALLARRLVALHRKGMAADLDQVRRREELHPRRVADDGVHQRALVEHTRGQAGMPRLDGAGQADGPGTDDHHVQHLLGSLAAVLHGSIVARAFACGFGGQALQPSSRSRFHVPRSRSRSAFRVRVPHSAFVSDTVAVVHPSLEQLHRLQELERQAAALRADLDAVDQRRREIEAPVLEARAALDALNATIEDRQTQRRAGDRDVAAAQQRLTKFKQQLMAVTNAREYEAVQHEIATVEGELKAREDQTISLLFELDELTPQAEAASRTLAAPGCRRASRWPARPTRRSGTGSSWRLSRAASPSFDRP